MPIVRAQMRAYVHRHLPRSGGDMRAAPLARAAVALSTSALLALGPASPAAGHPTRPPGRTTEVTYQADTGIVANPMRGFYHPADTDYRDAKGTGYIPLDEATLRSWRAEGITQVLREFWLQYFGGADGAWNLTPDLLRKV